MSNKKEREKRREQRLAEEAKASTGDRRTRMLQIGAGAVFLAIIAVVVVIVIASSNSDSGGDAQNLKEISQVDSLVNGIPQNELMLGDPKAPVELIEYGDLQCPACKTYSEEILPQVIENQVKNGEAKIIFRNFLIIGEQSLPAGAAAIAAGAQGRGWNFLELFYRNQGKENSGYVTDEFIEAVAEGAGVEDMDQFNDERTSKEVEEEAERTSERASEIGFESTPSFAIKGPNSNGLELPGALASPEEFEEEIERVS